ncbi:MAG: hypothetical protein AABY15_06785 [Nanoarchaeota archaeon]
MSNEKQTPKIEWTCTDPDNFQYGRKVSPGVYQFKEWIGGDSMKKPKEEQVKEEFENSGCWEEDTIVLANFNEKEIDNHISAYYDSLEALKKIYGDDWEWIVAECIFEQTSGLY